MNRFQFRLVHMAWLIVAAALVSGFLTAVDRARTAARASQCVNTAKFLLLMLRNDFDRTGKVRKSAELDGAGRPMHSWRSIIWIPEFPTRLPYDFTLPWNDPANLPVADEAPGTFVCPNSQRFPAPFTNVAAIVDGMDSSLDMIDPNGPRGPWVVLVEVPDSTIRWTEPRNVSPADIAGYPRPSDPGGFAVGLLDGSVARL